MTIGSQLRDLWGHKVVRQVCALALFVVPVSIIWISAVRPVVAAISDSKERVAESRALLQRYERLITSRPVLETQLASIQRGTASDGSFYRGGSPALMAARLQGDIQRLMQSSGVEPRSSQILPAGGEAGFQRVGLLIEFVTDANGLARFLQAAERSSPALFVDELSIQVPPSGISPPTAAGQPGLAGRCRIFAYGYGDAP